MEVQMCNQTLKGEEKQKKIRKNHWKNQKKWAHRYRPKARKLKANTTVTALSEIRESRGASIPPTLTLSATGYRAGPHTSLHESRSFTGLCSAQRAFYNRNIPGINKQRSMIFLWN